jgi:hypothetical protein
MMAHWPAHNAVGVQPAMAGRGERLRYGLRHSPDLAPIKPWWAKVKTAIRQGKARPRAVLNAALGQAMVTVSPVDAWGWCKHYGYRLH